MRAIFFFLILTIFIITGCASVEVVKEATKATKVIENSFKKLFEPSDEKEPKEDRVEKESEENLIDIVQNEDFSMIYLQSKTS